MSKSCQKLKPRFTDACVAAYSSPESHTDFYER